MQPDFLSENEAERLKVENKCLRLKLMLENGAQFSEEATSSDLPLEIENEFLNRIIEFETQFKERKTITIRERLGNPTDLKPDAEMSDAEVEKAWAELEELFSGNDISLSVCSPNVKTREIYSFAIGEFMDLEMDDIRMEGMMNCFIYDEFYPDPVYECEVTARDSVLRSIFSKTPILNEFDFAQKDIELNGQKLATWAEFLNRIETFKGFLEDIEVEEILINRSEVEERTGTVAGSYTIDAHLESDQFRITGTWEVGLKRDEDFGYWIANAITIRGIDFI